MVNLFLLPASQPGIKDPQDTTLSEALESCFPHLLDGAVLHWRGIAVPLSYKYDLSIIIQAVLALVRHLRTGSGKNFAIAWPSNTFRTDWHVALIGSRVRVTAAWESVSAQWGPLEEALNAAPVVEASRADFLAQWVALLRFANQALLDTGYTPAELEDYAPLGAELAHHPQ
jgi:hypothetical protein